MPKAPILDREMFYDTLRNTGTLRLLDWQLVNTEVGAMLEPRPLSFAEIGADQAQIDLTDMSVNRISPSDEDTFFSVYLGGGQQLPRDYS